MANVSLDQTTTGSGNGAASYAVPTAGSINIAANSLVLVKTHVSNTGAATPTAAGLTFVQIGSDLTSSNGVSRLYRAFTSVALSGAVITITNSGFPQSSATADTYINPDTTGTNGSGAVGATNTFTSGGSNAPTANVTTTRDNSLVVSMGGETGSLAWTAGSGQTVNSTIAGPGFSTSSSERRNTVTATLGTTVTGNYSLSGSGAVDLFVVEILAPILVSSGGYLPTRISNRFVGPQALRYLYRQPIFTSTATNGPTVYTQALSASVSFTASIAKSTSRPFTASLSFTGAFAKAIRKALTAAISFTGSIPTRVISHKLTASLPFTGAVNKFTTRTLPGFLPFTGAVAKLTARAQSAAISFTATLVTSRLRLVALTAALAFTGAVTKSPRKNMTAALPFTGSISRHISHNLGATLSMTAALAKRTSRVVSGSISYTASIARSTRKAVSAALSFTASIAMVLSHSSGTQYVKALTGSLAFTGSVSKRTTKSMSATLSFVGTLIETYLTTPALTMILNIVTKVFGYTPTNNSINLDVKSVPLTLNTQNSPLTIDVANPILTLEANNTTLTLDD